MKLKIRKILSNAKIPSYAHSGDAGMDVFSAENYLLKSGEIYAFQTGICSEFSGGYVAIIHDKSGLALNHGIKTMGGVIDSSYRGEWKIIIKNLGKKDYEVNIGDKIAQVIFYKFQKAEITTHDNLSKTKRSSGGFGSTGK